MPTDNTNNTTTNNVAQNVVVENLPQLLDSRGGSHVTNIPEFDKEDFSCWKDRFLVYLDGLKPYLLEILENRPFVPLSSLSTSTNPLHKPQKQWSHAERRLANQDKRLKSIIISYLPNDVMKFVIKCVIAKAMWNDLILAHKGPSKTRDTKIAALRLKFNAFKALKGEKDSDSNVKEDQRSSSEYLVDLNEEFHERALLANQKRFYKRSGRVGSAKKPMDNNNQKDYKVKYKGLNAKIAVLTKKIDAMSKGKSDKGLVAESFDCDEEPVSFDGEGVTKVKAFMDIAEDEPFVGKAGIRLGQWVKITMKMVQRLLSMTDGNERKHVLDYTHVDLYYMEDQRKNLLSKFNSLKQELSLCMYLAALSVPSEEEERKKTLFPQRKYSSLRQAKPIGTSIDVLTLADLTLTLAVSEEIKKVTNNRSAIKAPKKKAQTLSTYVPDSIIVNKDNSSTEQLLLTLMENIKGLKEKIETSLNNSTYVSQIGSSKSVKGKQKTWFGPFLFTKTQGTIFNQNNEVVLVAPRRRDVYVIDIASYNEESSACFFAKASPSVNWIWHNRLSYLNFNNINKLAKQNIVAGLPSLTFSKDKTCSSCEKGKHHRASFKTKRSFSINKCLHLLHMDLFGHVKPQTINHNKYTLVIVDEYSRSIIRKRHGKTTYDVFRGRYPDISYFYMFGFFVHIHNHRDHLGKFDKKADDEFFLEYTIADDHPVMNKLDVFESADNLDLAESQDIIINEPISEAEPSQTIISPSAEVFINPFVPQDRWSREKHIDLVNIIGEPLAGVTTRSTIRESKAASAHECLYVNFLFEIELKRLIEALEEE
ncbi:retrovirus-related pol polyprotein from transposon TNT 1-94 [Tanacetum coccineum]